MLVSTSFEVQSRASSDAQIVAFRRVRKGDYVTRVLADKRRPHVFFRRKSSYAYYLSDLISAR